RLRSKQQRPASKQHARKFVQPTLRLEPRKRPSRLPTAKSKTPRRRSEQLSLILALLVSFRKLTELPDWHRRKLETLCNRTTPLARRSQLSRLWIRSKSTSLLVNRNIYPLRNGILLK